MKMKIFYSSILILICTCYALFAQNQMPSEYTNPQELVSFNSDLDLAIALDLLSEYAIQYAQKPIYDPRKRSGAIGIDIRSLAWQKALGLILSRKGLWYIEKPRYFEIVDAKQAETSLSSMPSINLDSNLKLKPGSREIKIETIFFEGDRKMLSEFGIDWTTFYRGQVGVEASQIGALNMKEEFFTIKTGIGRNLIGVDIDALIKAFDSRKLGKVLAQPQVIVTEGKEGDIQVGQDFSIKERDFAGNVIDRFYSTGTIMKVTPYIIENKKEDGKEERPTIFLRIHVERSTAHPDVVSTIINKSQANSFIQLYDGEETLIAGLYSTENTKIRKGVPILKDLPWWFFGLPYIFGYNSTEEKEKELIIIIKATLLKTVIDRQNLARTEVMNIKNSLVENYDIKLKNQNYSSQPARMKPKRNVTPPPAITMAKTNTEPEKNIDQSLVTTKTKTNIAPKKSIVQPRRTTITKTITEPEKNITEPPATTKTNIEPENTFQSPEKTKTNIEPENTFQSPVTTVKSEEDFFEAPTDVFTMNETKAQPQRNYRFGKILKIGKNQTALVEWLEPCDPEEFVGKKLLVVRKDDLRRKMENIGVVQILETRKNHSVGKQLNNDKKAQTGDYLVVQN